MEITVYKRHSKDCEHKADRAFRRCSCRMMLEWSESGKRFRVSAKTRSWTEAEQRARARMQDAHARSLGEQPKASEPVTLERAVEMFTAKKSSKHKQTRRKYQYTLNNLKAWAVRNGRHYLADITESDLEKYQASWNLKSNYAKRNEQERLRSFFRYCCSSAEIRLAYNPTAQLEHFNVSSDEPEDPYTEKEYKAIVAAADRVPGFTGEVAERVKALIAVMRYAGLAIQDAAILERGAVSRQERYRWSRDVEKFGERAFPGVGQKRAEETRIAELERKIGQQVLEIDFLKRALQHVEQQRQLRATSGGAPFTNKSSAK